VNGTAHTDLLRELKHMQQHGGQMLMLVMIVRGTSHGLLAGIKGEVFSLDYPRAGWLDFVRARRFASFCKAKGFPLQNQTWGKERVSRAAIGSVVANAIQTIDECFSAVYNQSGQFDLDLRGFGWQPSPEPSPHVDRG
jgi:hypothetical protein